MKSYQTLVKLQKIEIDRIKKEMIQIQTVMEEQRQTLLDLDEELRQETAAFDSGEQAEMVTMNFEQYYQVNRYKYKNIQAQLNVLENQLAYKQEELQSHFEELKKIEYIIEEKLAEQKREASKAEQKFLDDYRKHPSLGLKT